MGELKILISGTDPQIKEAILKISESNFCTGNNDRNWKADFDWLFGNDTNILKALEGKYDNKEVKDEKSKGNFTDYSSNETQNIFN